MNEYIVVDTRRGGGSLEQLLALAAEGYEIVPPDGLVIFAPAPRRIRSNKRVTVEPPASDLQKIDDPSKPAE